jgi:hypothetical protein
VRSQRRQPASRFARRCSTTATTAWCLSTAPPRELRPGAGGACARESRVVAVSAANLTKAVGCVIDPSTHRPIDLLDRQSLGAGHPACGLQIKGWVRSATSHGKVGFLLKRLLTGPDGRALAVARLTPMGRRTTCPAHASQAAHVPVGTQCGTLIDLEATWTSKPF